MALFLLFSVFQAVGQSSSYSSAIKIELNQVRMSPYNYGSFIGVDLSEYTPVRPLILDVVLERKAQAFAEKLLRNGDLYHSKMRYNESVLWNYNPFNAIDQFISEEYAMKPGQLGHREHMLNSTDTYVGIGVVGGNVGQYYRYYVVILTK